MIVRTMTRCFRACLGVACVAPLAISTGACSTWRSPAPRVDVRGALDADRDEATPAAPRTPASHFAELRDKILDQWLADDPTLDSAQGKKPFEQRVGDYDADAIIARWARVEQAREDLAAVDESSLAPDDALDLAIMRSQADLFLFNGVELESWRKQPLFYEELFFILDDLDRANLAFDEDPGRLLERAKEALGQTPNVLKNLRGPMSKHVLAHAIEVYRGHARELEHFRAMNLPWVQNPTLKADLDEATAQLAAEAENIADHLEKVELPRGDDSHVLGRRRYERLLELESGLHVSLDELTKLAEDNLALNRRAFTHLAKTATFTRPKTNELLFGAAVKIVDDARKLVVDRDLVTILTDRIPSVQIAPRYITGGAALSGSTYMLKLPDPAWTPARQETYRMPFGVLLSTTVHEVFPGHFLQAEWEKRAPTRAQRTLLWSSFEEGWAHYGEQLMIEEGLGAGDPQNKLGQLSDALLRNCRAVVSIGVHTRGMTLQQAEKRFVRDCHQDEVIAQEEAERAALDPAYFNYTLGKLLILELRDEAKQRLGSKFTLKGFHDALLAHGAPPVPFIRERVLKDLEGAAR